MPNPAVLYPINTFPPQQPVPTLDRWMPEAPDMVRRAPMQPAWGQAVLWAFPIPNAPVFTWQQLTADLLPVVSAVVVAQSQYTAPVLTPSVPPSGQGNPAFIHQPIAGGGGGSIINSGRN
jgi:hypothetical protein